MVQISVAENHAAGEGPTFHCQKWKKASVHDSRRGIFPAAEVEQDCGMSSGNHHSQAMPKGKGGNSRSGRAWQQEEGKEGPAQQAGELWHSVARMEERDSGPTSDSHSEAGGLWNHPGSAWKALSGAEKKVLEPTQPKQKPGDREGSQRDSSPEKAKGKEPRKGRGERDAPGFQRPLEGVQNSRGSHPSGCGHAQGSRPRPKAG